MCRAKTSRDKDGNVCACGLSYPAKLWTKKGTKWKFKCRVDWSALALAALQESEKGEPPVLNKWVKRLRAKFGDDISKWPQIGCGANFYPFRNGYSMVVELRIQGDHWEAIAADRVPEILDNAIKAHQYEFYLQFRRMTPEELKEVVPVSLPMTHVMDPDLYPGVSRFPVAEWEARGEPVITTAGWCKLAMKVANKNLKDLSSVFEVAQKELSRL